MWGFSVIVMLCIGARFGCWPQALTKLFKITDYIGRWSIVDVFVPAGTGVDGLLVGSRRRGQQRIAISIVRLSLWSDRES
jgi:hypothetical protein